jgi:hypothetical protein
VDDPLFAVPGTRRSRSEVERLRRNAEQLVDDRPDDATARGALDAARWTLREEPEAPLTPDRAADPLGLDAERVSARGIALGVSPGDRARAAGVRAGLDWWMGLSAAPSWLAAPTRRR